MRVSVATTTTNGTLTNSTQRQSRYSVNRPLSSTPTHAPGGGDHTPGGQRPAPLGTLRDAHHDHGQCQGGQYGCRHPLGGTGGDELPGAVGEAAEDGGDTKKGQRGEHGAPVPDQIGDPSAQQQQATEGQGVGTDHPRQ